MNAIYQPKGAAREYANWACNLYNGCSNRCDYYQRMENMKQLFWSGVTTWASVEPVNDLKRALRVIEDSAGFCDGYRIGLATKVGMRFDSGEVSDFVDKVHAIKSIREEQIPIHWKQSILKHVSASDLESKYSNAIAHTPIRYINV